MGKLLFILIVWLLAAAPAMQEPETEKAEELCAAAYLGYMEGEYSDFQTFAKENGILEYVPFLAEVPEENTVLGSGGEWYLLVPAEDTVSFTVYECVMDETTFQLIAGKELLALEAGESLLLRGNVSDIFPSFLVIVTAADGREIHYAPGLSLKDGSLNVVDGVQDFTEYPKEQQPAE